MKSNEFSTVLSNKFRKAWDALKAVIQNVLGKHRAEPNEVKRLVNAMLNDFEKINVSMTLKLHFLHHHLDVLLQQLPTESDEQGERFHQITMPMEKRYKGKRLDAMLAEVCWCSHKVSLYDDEEVEDPASSQQVTPSDAFSGSGSTDSDTDSDHDVNPTQKKFKT